MDSPFRSLYANPQPWIELEHGLQLAHSKLPTTEWMPTVDRPIAKDIGEPEKLTIRRQLASPFQQHVEQYGAAIEHFLNAKQWPEDMPEPVVYYLHLAFLHAIRFVRATVAGDAQRPVSIFPFPTGDPGIVALWLVTEWWQAHGLREYAEESTTDSAIFHRFFA